MMWPAFRKGAEVIEVHIKADGPMENVIMATVNELIERLKATGAKADAEHAQVVAAVTSLKDEVSNLRDIIANQPLPEVDLAPAFAALDEIDAKIDGIYTPDAAVEPPAPPAGTGE